MIIIQSSYYYYTVHKGTKSSVIPSVESFEDSALEVELFHLRRKIGMTPEDLRKAYAEVFLATP